MWCGDSRKARDAVFQASWATSDRQQLRVLTTHPAQGMSQEGGRRTNRQKDREWKSAGQSESADREEVLGQTKV